MKQQPASHITPFIQQAQQEDLREILELQKLAFLTEAESHGNYDIEPLKQTYESIAQDSQTHTFLKAIADNRIIGSVKYRNTDKAIWVGKLIVHPEFRGRGLGRKLLLEVENLNLDIRQFRLFTASSSVWNIRLYESVGYKVCREYTDNTQSGLTMVEMLKER